MFTLNDLTDDMIVETIRKEKFLVVSNGKVMINSHAWIKISDYSNDLTIGDKECEDSTINKVWKITSQDDYAKLSQLLTDDFIDYQTKMGYVKLVYDRESLPKKMTIQQICDELGYEVEIVKGE